MAVIKDHTPSVKPRMSCRTGDIVNINTWGEHHFAMVIDTLPRKEAWVWVVSLINGGTTQVPRSELTLYRGRIALDNDL